MLLKCKSGWGLKFCISHSFQKMSVMLLSGLPLSSKCVLKGEAVNSSSEVIMSTECRIQHFQIVWIWTSYVISCSLSSSVKWDKKEWGYPTGLLCRTNEFIHVKHIELYLALTTTILLSTDLGKQLPYPIIFMAIPCYTSLIAPLSLHGTFSIPWQGHKT